MKKTTAELNGSNYKNYKSTIFGFAVILVLGILLVLSLVVFPGLISSWRSGRLNDKGMRKYDEGDFIKASEAFAKAVSLDPENAAARYNNGLVFLAVEDDPYRAAENLKEVVRIEPGWARAYHNLGVIELFYQHKTALALDNLRTAVTLEPGYAPTHFALGYLYEYTGEYGKAEEEFTECISTEPTGPFSDGAEAHLRALKGAPVFDDLAEKLSYEEAVYEVIITGDIYLDKPGESMVSSVLPTRFIGPILENAAFRVGSLAALSTEGGGPILDESLEYAPGRDDMVYVLTEAGFDAVAITGGEIPKYKSKEFENTFRRMEEEGILYTGAGSNPGSALKPVYADIGDVTLAVFGFYGGVSGGADMPSGKAVYATLSPDTAFPAIQRMSGDADVSIVLINWGNRSGNAPDGMMKKSAHGLVDAGADIVVGTGRDVVLQIERYKGAVIAYGIPDFIPHYSRGVGAYTQILAVEYSPVNGIIGYRLVPAYVPGSRLTLNEDNPSCLLDTKFVRSVPPGGS
jgi:hypothetical protein